MKPTITTCVICPDLEDAIMAQNLSQCLKSIQFTDEIIIITNAKNEAITNIASKFNCAISNIPKYENYADT